MDNIEEFLLTPVPGSPITSDLGKKWQLKAKSLGSAAPLRFVEALRTGHWIMHEAAILALRLFGWKSGEVRGPHDGHYAVIPPGETDWMEIHPKYFQDLSRYSALTPELYLHELRHDHWILHGGAQYHLAQDGYSVEEMRSPSGEFYYTVHLPDGKALIINPEFVPPAEKVDPGAWLWGDLPQ